MLSKYIRYAGPAAFAIALATGCTKGDNNNSLAQDTSALNADLSLANKDTANTVKLADTGMTTSSSVRQSAGGNAAVTHKSTTRTHSTSSTGRTSTTKTGGAAATGSTTGAGTGEATGARKGMIPAGSTLSLRTNSKVCTNTNHVGDRVMATVNETVSGSGGAAIPAGATVTLEVTKLDRSENVNDKIQMGFRVVSISFGGHTYSPDASVTYAQITKVKNEPKSKDVQKVVGGAAVGAVIGKIIGKSTKGAVIGGAAGAAAGAAAASATANYEGCVNSGDKITIRFNSGEEVYL